MLTTEIAGRYAGSRKHVLDWTAQPTFAAEMASMVAPAPVRITDESLWMPRGYDAPEEALLNRFGPDWLDRPSVWESLQAWWLVHRRNANTPNWDIAVGCEIGGQPGLVLVEAKANWPELDEGGKRLSTNPSTNSLENHARIGAAIEEANQGWQAIDQRVSISRDSHYQLSNRLAFTWKLATLGIPVVLVYLGFTGDSGIADVGAPFADDHDWQRAMASYAGSIFPTDCMNRTIDVQDTLVWVLVRSKPVLSVSPKR
jgi:hypothetical protein